MISFSKVDMNCDLGDKLQVLNEDRNYLLYDQCHQTSKKSNNKTVINFALVRAKFVLMRMQTVSNRTMTSTFDVVFIDTPPQQTPDSTNQLPLRQQSAAGLAIPTARPLAPPTTQNTKAQSHCIEINLTTLHLIKDYLLYFFDFKVSCSSTPQEMNDLYGSLSTPALRGDYIYDTNCSWIIRAPQNQVFRLKKKQKLL